jgi:hypothetical protein
MKEEELLRRARSGADEEEIGSRREGSTMPAAALFVASLVVLQSGPMRQAGGAAGAAPVGARDCFAIRVVDRATKRGVPLVELRTVDATSWWSDSEGVVAVEEPGLIGVETWFFVQSPGYELPADGFGNRGVRLTPTRGGRATIELDRTQIAERLYRLTGAGIDRDSVLAGLPVPICAPLLNGEVTGQDTVVSALYRGKIHWFFGDTNRVAYPLGQFAVSGAVSDPPDRGGLDPLVGVDLTYWVDEKGFSRPMVALPGPGLHWIEAPFVVKDEAGRERLAARVATHVDLGPAKCWHLVVFNDDKSIFEPVKQWDWHEGHDSAHPFRATVDGVEYVYLYPNLRVKPELRRLEDLDQYEALTCVAGDGKVHGSETKIERDASGRALYRWIGGADRLSPGRILELVAAGVMKREDGWIALVDVENDAPIEAGRGSVFWNILLQHWVMICAAAIPGEIWFSSADTPVGPWGYARRVATHGDYNFYNPTQEPLFDQHCGHEIFFTGTYTTAFSAAKAATPRYDYNEIMYRLTLSDPRLELPIAIYRVRDAGGGEKLWRREQVEEAHAWDRIEEVAFFSAPANASPAIHRGQLAIPIYERRDEREPGATSLSLSAGSSGDVAVFLGFPLAEPGAGEGAVASSSPSALIVLHGYRRSDGRGCCYSTSPTAPPGCEPGGRPLCRVLKAPSSALVIDWKAKPIDPRGR